MILFIIILVFLLYEVDFDRTIDGKLLMWYTHNRQRKYKILWK